MRLFQIEVKDDELGDAFEKIVGKDNISTILSKYIETYTTNRMCSNPLNGRVSPYLCKKCNLPPNKYGDDQCISNLGNVANACCGHGEAGYIQFDNGIHIKGVFTITKFEAR